MRFEVLMVMKMLMLSFWFVTMSRLVGRYQRFRDIYILHI
jgi:hypothetical protein